MAARRRVGSTRTGRPRPGTGHPDGRGRRQRPSPQVPGAARLDPCRCRGARLHCAGRLRRRAQRGPVAGHRGPRTANTPRPSAPPTMRGRPRRKPKRQWRQDIRTRPKPRSTQRRAAYHKCAAKTVRPTCRTGSVTWRGSSTLPAAPPRHTTSEPSASPRSPRTSAAPKPTSQQTTHSSRPESPSARAKESHDSITETGSATTTTPQTHPTPQPTSASPTSPQHRGQPGKPPRPTRSATHRQRDQLQAPHGRTARQHQPAHHGSNRSSPATRTPRSPRHSRQAQATAAPSTGQAVEPSSSVRTTGNRQRQAAAKTVGLACPHPATTRESFPDSCAVMTPRDPYAGGRRPWCAHHARDPIEASVRARSTTDDCRGRGVVTHRGRRRGGGAPRQRRPRPGRPRLRRRTAP